MCRVDGVREGPLHARAVLDGAIIGRGKEFPQVTPVRLQQENGRSEQHRRHDRHGEEPESVSSYDFAELVEQLCQRRLQTVRREHDVTASRRAVDSQFGQYYIKPLVGKAYSCVHIISLTKSTCVVCVF